MAAPYWPGDQDSVAAATAAVFVGDPESEPDMVRWFGAFHAEGHTPRDWAIIGDAIRNADDIAADTAARRIDIAGGPFVRGGPTWCRLAANTHDYLHASGGYAHLSPLRSGVCFADPTAIAVWLSAPIIHTQPGRATVGDALDLPQYGRCFNVYHGLETLIGDAQRAGVFGIPGQRVEVWHLVDVDQNHDGHSLTVHTPDGLVIASPVQSTDDLIDPDTAGIDAAIAVLTTAAGIVNTTLARHNTADDPRDPTVEAAEAREAAERRGVELIPLGNPGRAFMPLGPVPTTPPPDPPASLPQPTPPAAPRPRRR